MNGENSVFDQLCQVTFSRFGRDTRLFGIFPARYLPLLPDVFDRLLLSLAQLDAHPRATGHLSRCEDNSEGVCLYPEDRLRQTLDVAVVKDALDTGAKLLDVLDEEESVGNELVARFRLMLAAEIFNRHALGHPLKSQPRSATCS